MKPNRQIMRAAWSLSRAGAARFGGTTGQYIRESLRMVWADYLSNVDVLRCSGSLAPLDTLDATGERRSVSETPSNAAHMESKMNTISKLGLVVMFAMIPVVTAGTVVASVPVMVAGSAAFLSAFAAGYIAEAIRVRERNERVRRYRLCRF